MEIELSAPHERTYQRVFEHPMAHDLPWQDVWSMLSAIGDAKATADDKGNFKVTRNARTLLLHHPSGRELADKKELMHVRVFLERSGAPVARPAPGRR